MIGHTLGPILFNKNTNINELKKTVCNIRLTKNLRADPTNIVGKNSIICKQKQALYPLLKKTHRYLA